VFNPSLPSYRVVRMVHNKLDGSLWFSNLSTPSGRYLCKNVLPPPSCWSQKPHPAPDPDCRCGYHAFWDLPSALDYAILVSPIHKKLSASRFIAEFIPTDPYPYSPTTSQEFRTSGGTYVSLILPSRCFCSKRASSVHIPKLEAVSLDGLDQVFGLDTIASACSKHGDESLLSKLSKICPITFHKDFFVRPYFE
jgi:hypothetical protein